MSLNLLEESVFSNVKVNTEVEKDITPIYEITYIEKSGFGAYVVEDLETEQEFNVSGIFATPLAIGQTYKLKGTVVEYKGNKQLQVSKVSAIKPKTERGIIAYLKSLNQISEKRAKLIYDAFKADSIDVLMKDPERVAKEINRVSIKLATQWQEELKEMLETQEIMLTLLDFGLSTKEAKKLHQQLGESVVDQIEQNPYILSKMVKGFGFEKCDRIARNIGVPANSPFRIQEGLIHTLKLATTAGHCFYPEDILVEEAKKILDVKLTVIEMRRLTKEFVGQEYIEYIMGEKCYNLKYDLVAKYLNAYENERSSVKREAYRFPVVKIDEKAILAELDTLRAQFRVIVDDDRVYLKDIYQAELIVAKRVLEISNDPEIFDRKQIETLLNTLTSKTNVELEDKQKEACIEFNTNLGGFYILDGSAGTGKTFTLKYILELARLVRTENLYKEPTIFAFAPTGKASKVASKSIGMQCVTIHRGLGYNPATGDFEYHEENPFKADIIVCDETSMLDIKLASYFVKAVKNGTKVIFMGDTKQLASVGAGNVLKDLIESDAVKVVTLNVVKRQGLLSGIIRNANNIIAKNPIVTCDDTKDAYFLPRESAKNAQTAVISSIHRIIKRGIEFDEIQVLSPQRVGSLGVYVLNYLIQQEFNPNNNEVTVQALKFRAKLNELEEDKEYILYFKKNDKIINIRNDYDLIHYKKDAYGNFVPKDKEVGITNGECGIIERIDKIKRNKEGKEEEVVKMVVKYEDFYAVYEDDFSDLEHSYCLTIHKSQGSAWKSVILPFSNSHYNMLDNNLIYTAWTRAREFAVAIGQAKAIERGVNKSNARARYTTLSDRLQGKVSL